MARSTETLVAVAIVTW